MSLQTLRVRKLIARFLSKWRKGAKSSALSGCVGCVDEVGTIRFKPSLHIRPDLPDNYQILTRTLIS